MSKSFKFEKSVADAKRSRRLELRSLQALVALPAVPVSEEKSTSRVQATSVQALEIAHEEFYILKKELEQCKKDVLWQKEELAASRDAVVAAKTAMVNAQNDAAGYKQGFSASERKYDLLLQEAKEVRDSNYFSEKTLSDAAMREEALKKELFIANQQIASNKEVISKNQRICDAFHWQSTTAQSANLEMKEQLLREVAAKGLVVAELSVLKEKIKIENKDAVTCKDYALLATKEAALVSDDRDRMSKKYDELKRDSEMVMCEVSVTLYVVRIRM
jgi:chromosome segregation ATPase